MLDFTNKNVVVTGGSRGIGAASGKLFARLNANVSFNYHSNKNAADDVINQINSLGIKYIAEKCDISDPDQI
jgi:3-oxoacyl-[acyl-carrier protein] reductase